MNLTKGQIIYAILAIIIIIYGGLTFQNHFEPNPGLEKNLTDVIISIGVVTILMERVLEIIIKIWRGTERINLQTSRDKRNDQLTIAKKEFEEGKIDKDQLAIAQDNFQLAENELQKYRSGTTKIALRSSFFIGLIISIVGFRVLGPIYQVPSAFVDYQKNLFYMTDIFLSAGLISGGSEGLHLFTSVLGNFLNETKKKLNTTQVPNT